MISESQMRYGSRVRRHGKSRWNRENHASRFFRKRISTTPLSMSPSVAQFVAAAFIQAYGVKSLANTMYDVFHNSAGIEPRGCEVTMILKDSGSAASWFSNSDREFGATGCTSAMWRKT